MERLEFYRVNIDYIKYMWHCDKKVQYNSKACDDYTQRRPYVGVVLNINEHKYFAPLEHPRPNHVAIKGNGTLLKIEGGKYGLIAFNNMIPIKTAELIAFDIKDENQYYRYILERQFIFCNEHKSKITKMAENTYKTRINGDNKFFNKICCDFALLEKKCDLY